MRTRLGWVALALAVGGASCRDAVPTPARTPLTVSSVEPADAATDVQLDVAVRLTFSGALACGTASLAVASTSGPLAGTTTCEGRTLTFTPSVPLPAGAEVQVTVPGAVEGEAAGALGADFHAAFSTGGPRVLGVSPADGATGTGPGTPVTVRFWDRMDCPSLPGALRLGSEAGEVAGRVACTGQAASFLPERALQPGTRYTVRAGPPALDFAGNHLATFSATFTTGEALAAVDAVVPDGTVSQVALSPDGGTVYLAGSFRSVGPRTGSAVLLDAATGARVRGHALVDGWVSAVVADGRGGWFIGGAFTTVGGLPRAGVAHLLASGEVDPAFRADLDLWPDSLALAGDTLYLAGPFEHVAGEPRDQLAAVEAATGRLTAWAPAAHFGRQATVRIVATPSAVLVAERSYPPILVVDRATAAFTTLSLRGTAWHLATDGARVYLAGTFDTVLGATREGLAALDAATLQLTDWEPALHLEVRSLSAMTVAGGTVYLAGDFASMGGKPRNGLAAVDGLTGVVAAWNPAAPSEPRPPVSALAVQGSTVYVAGEFDTLGGQDRPGLAAVHATTGLVDPAWAPGPGFGVQALGTSGAGVLAGGELASLGGARRGGLAAVDARTGALLPWAPATDQGPGSGVCGLAVRGSLIHAALYRSGSQGWVQTLKVVDAATGRTGAWGPALAPGDSACRLLAAGDTVFLAGSFRQLGGVPRSSLAALDGTSGGVRAWSPFPAGALENVFGLALTGTTLHLASYGGLSGVLSVDTATGADAGVLAVGGDRVIYALAADPTRPRVYLGGIFDSASGAPRLNLAARDPGGLTGWNPATSSLDRYALVDSLFSTGPLVYVGGRFDFAGGQPRLNLAALDAETGAATAWSPRAASGLSAGQPVVSLVATPTAVYVGGPFTTVGDEVRGHFAILPP